MIMCLILLLAMTAILIFPNICWKEGLLIWKIVYNVCVSLMTLYCVYWLLEVIQIAIISETGITIRNIFGNIACIEWETIASVTKEKVVTHASRAQILFDWIIIRTDNSQTVNYLAKNKRNIAPWQIIANKKNMAIIKAALKRYRPVLLENNKSFINM